ncbi:hypothetical protein HJC23_006872 [Cyclotella cryptica]|uniref:N-acetyltransferase domain-containing protein n=1 Tax=Cyclotella cryptica TaxID=29204 RepID=A0ABD3QD25_9STRA
MNAGNEETSPLLSRLIFRTVQPTDVPRCHSIESSSYPPDEAASKSDLQYRQHHAASYFRCAFLIDEPGATSGDAGGYGHLLSVTGCIVGYICSTRCNSFTARSLKHHDPNGKYLAIHSVAVDEKYRKLGVGSAMLKDYWEVMERLNQGVVEGLKNKNKVRSAAMVGRGGTSGGKKSALPMEKIVLMAKKDLLAFYVRNGFAVTKVSEIVHGKEEWFELERRFSVQSLGNESKECYLIDAFVDPSEKNGRSGNPAGVVILPGPPGVDDDEQEVKQMRLVSSSESLEDMQDTEEQESPVKITARGAEWMSAVAKELNQSETAFVWPLLTDATQLHQQGQLLINGTTFSSQLMQHGDEQPSPSSPSSVYAIRYYTRTGVEVDLCGHATLASASVLLNHAQGTKGQEQLHQDEVINDRITFCAKNDVLYAELLTTCSTITSALGSSSAHASAQTANTRIAMNFPWKNVSPVQPGKDGRDAILDILSRAFFGAGAATASNPVVASEESTSAIAAKFRQFFNPKDPHLAHHVLYIGVTDGKEDLFLELTEEGFDLLRGINVNHSALCEWAGYSRGVIICCSCGVSSSELSGEKTSTTIEQPCVDFRSRFFGPKVGINEDPVTGSAHCALGPYFGSKLNKTVVVGKQESDRGGLVECTLKPEEGRVQIVGTAAMTLSGKLSVPL